MNWKVGDQALALFDVYLIKNSSDSDSHELKVRAGNLYSVLEVSEKDGHVLLDVGIRKRAAFFDYSIVCIQCKPLHLITITESYSNLLLNLASWFKKIDPDQDVLKEAEELSNKRPKLYIFEGIPVFNPKPSEPKTKDPKPKKTEPSQPKTKPKIKEEEVLS
jgi:hypothetical protein